MTGPQRVARRVRGTCLGCSQAIGADVPWCQVCERRMPTRLREAFAQARHGLDDAVRAGQEWLRAHPHATAREIEVIALAAQGLSNAEIAGRLGCTVDQVKDALRQVSRRWGCSGRAHVVATAFRLGYLQLEIPRGVVTR